MTDKNQQDAYADGRPTISLKKDPAPHSMQFDDGTRLEIRHFRGAEHIELERTGPHARGERRWLVAILLACIVVLATALALAASALLGAT